MTDSVLHVTGEFGARSETFVYTTVVNHRDFHPSVLCDSRANAAEFPFPDVHVLPAPRSRRTFSWWMGRAVESTTGRSLWRRRVDALLARLSPSVIHAHFGSIGCGMIDAAVAAGIPMVTSLYGVDAAVLPYLPQWRRRYARLFDKGDLFLGEGPEMCRKIVAAGAPAERTVLQPIAIDVARYPGWSPGRSKTVLFVGRFVEKKGLLDAIAAFARARARCADTRLVIVGAGPQDAAARARTAELRLSESVEFTGPRPHAEVIARLASARVVIHPSRTAADGDSEGGAPTLLLEAQAVGAPIVATRHADIPNVTPSGPGVYLCDEGDVVALGDALATALERGEASSPAYVRQHHDVDVAIAGLEAKYRGVIARTVPGL